jgi:hypothetical protein
MKLIFLLLFNACVAIASAQNIVYRDNAFYIDDKKIVSIKQTHYKHIQQRYFVQANNGDDLVKIYDSKIELNRSPSMIVKFLNDNRICIVARNNPDFGFIINQVRELIRLKVINEGDINPQAEKSFIEKHPAPKGYEDVDDMRLY